MSPAGPLRVGFGSWRAAVRIAWRESRRARGRTALILAMITLPVLALTFAAATWDMFQLTPQEEAVRRLGAADVQLRWATDGPLRQVPNDASYGSEAPARQRPVTVAELAALLPANSRVVPLVEQSRLRLVTPDGVTSMQVRGIEVGDPLVRGIVRLRSGRAPRGPGEVAATGPALRRLGVAPGGTVTLADGSRTFRVVGVVEFPAELGEMLAVPPAGLAEPPDVWLADIPVPVGPDLVRRLNAQGVLVETAPGSPVYPTDEPPAVGPVDQESVSLSVLVGGLGLLEVVLLAGPAFAVGVRRRQRELALVAANGGTPAQLRRIVLADGLVLGLAGAGLGLALGAAAAVAARPLVAELLYQHRPGGYRFFPEALVAIATLAVLTGVLAALVPAYTAGRQDVVAGLTGRRGATRSRRWLVLGLCLAGTGSVTAALAATRVSTWGILIGLVLGEIGLVLCTPSLVGLLGRLGRGAPLALRIALRDTSRNRAAAAPAISAVLAAVAGSVATGAWLASDEALTAARYQPTLPPGYVTAIRSEADPGNPPLTPESVGELARGAGVAATAVATLSVPGCGPGTAPGASCWLAVRRPAVAACPEPARWPPSAAERERARTDPRCRSADGVYYYDTFYLGMGTVVDDGPALPLMTGASGDDLARATAVLRAGGVVIAEPWLVVDGRVTVEVYRNTVDSRSPELVTLDLPGYALTTGLRASREIYSPGALAQAGLAGHDIGFVLGTSAAPTDAAQKRFTGALARHDDYQVLVGPDGPPTTPAPFGLVLAVAAGLVTLGAAGIATGLAAAEGRADLTTLAAVGASPGVRRTLAVSRAGVIAGVGTLLGIVAGLGAAGTILTAINRAYADTWPPTDPYPLVVPWLPLGVLLVVPLLAMLGAGLLTRSRLPIERRVD
ncbi:FtsX-like permease family protein [Micromonospora sp. CPCC 206060]|uniref:FtsX-like permease family protein n=1 Tax=Micromonospora sp. CPCC 206060 TaxID=3122406 RepID=UPI002FF037A0